MSETTAVTLDGQIVAAPKITERMMLDRLNVRYGKTYKNGPYVGRQFVRAEQVPTIVGRWGSHRNADFISIDMWSTPHRALTAEEQADYNWAQAQSFHGHEVKVSRSDLLVELKEPEKAEAWAQYMHYWWLVVPDAKLTNGLPLPEEWGVMVSHGRSLRVLRPAQRRFPIQMPHGVIAGLTRAVMKTETTLALTPTSTQGEER